MPIRSNLANQANIQDMPFPCLIFASTLCGHHLPRKAKSLSKVLIYGFVAFDHVGSKNFFEVIELNMKAVLILLLVCKIYEQEACLSHGQPNTASPKFSNQGEVK